MGNHGDDCYFFYYSTCTKGDNCPFRHCAAALGNEIVCNLWQEGHCFRSSCKFRHMEITKNRKEIPCYWETQAAGCQKPHCAFMHERPRTIEGIFFPADKSHPLRGEQPHEEPEAALPAPASAAAAASAAPVASSVSQQLRSVIKPEAMEPVPSPTHPPVVINAADDDEDEDEEGESGPSPRKISRSDNSLNFGVSTLEEIRLRKALKASMKRAGYSSHSADDVSYRQSSPLRKSLADRLGRTVFEEQPPQSALKPVKERLGLFTVSAINAQAAEINTDSKKAPEQIRIKTLEEIRKEKAAKSLSKQSPSGSESDEVKPVKDLRKLIVMMNPIGKTKSMRDAPASAAKKELEEVPKQPTAKLLVKKAVQSEPSPPATAPHLGGVQVKTLEEIRREKAARIEAQRGKEAEPSKDGDGESCSGKNSHLLLVKKAASPSNITVEKSSKVSAKSPSVQAAAHTTTAANGVKVKTFEEIMQEKRLRRQEMEEQARASPEAAPQKNSAQEKSKRKGSARVSRTSGSPAHCPSPTQSPPPAVALTPPPTTVVSPSKLPVRKLISLKSKAALVGNGDTPAAATSARGAVVSSAATASIPANQSLALKQQLDADAPSLAKRARTLPQGGTADVPVTEKTPQKTQEKLGSQVKVRPKLNVKPSVMKPEAHVKPGQKRKAAERSAVAAVKPLNSAAAGREEQLQTTSLPPRRNRQAFPSTIAEDGPVSTGPSQPSSSDPSLGLSEAEEELKSVPVTKDTRPPAREAAALGQSSSQPRSRRMSSQTAASSAVDDFDKLIMEFTDEDMLDDGVDNDVNEDDLLQELSEMIEIDG